jgi:hypothetical protein
MKLFEEKTEETNAIDSLGTVIEHIGKKGRIVLDANNLKRSDKLLIVDLFNDKGQKQRVFGSVALSAEVRRAKMTKEALLNFIAGLNIIVTTNDDGEERFKLMLPQGAKITGNAKDLEPVTEPVASELEEIVW